MHCPLVHLHIRLVSRSQMATCPPPFTMKSHGRRVSPLSAQELKAQVVLLVHLSQPEFDQKPFHNENQPRLRSIHVSHMPWHFSVHTWNLDALALGCFAPSGHMHLQSIYVHHSVGVCMTNTYTYAYILYVYYTHFSSLLPSLTMSLV